MAKKQETKTEVPVETPVMEAPPVVKQPTRKEPSNRIINDWEIKDRR